MATIKLKKPAERAGNRRPVRGATQRPTLSQAQAERERARMAFATERSGPRRDDRGPGGPGRDAGPRGDRPGGDRPGRDRPAGDRPRGDRPYGDRPFADRPRGDRPFGDRPQGNRPEGNRPQGDRPHGDRSFGDRPQGDRPFGDRPRNDRPRDDRGPRRDDDRPRFNRPDGGGRPFGDRPAGDRPQGDRPSGDRPYGDRPFGDRPPRGPARDDRPRQDAGRGDRPYGDRPAGNRPYNDRPRNNRPFGDRPSGDRPSGDRPSGDRSFGNRPQGDRPQGNWPRGDRPQGDRPQGDRPYSDRPSFNNRPRDDRAPSNRPYGDRPAGDRPFGDRPFGDRPHGDRPRNDRPLVNRPRGDEGPWSDRPPRQDRDGPARRPDAPAKPAYVQRREERAPQRMDAERTPQRTESSRPQSFPRADDDRPARGPSPSRFVESGAGERLSKRLGELGLASRREADDWIAAGWVRVDGRMAVLGQRVGRDAKIEIDPAAKDHQAQRVTIIINKPIGYVSGQAEDGYEPAVTLLKPENRWEDDPSHQKFHPGHLRGLAPAGRLDIDSTGLLVLTQDGRVARALIGEDSLVEKEYLVRVTLVNPPTVEGAEAADPSATVHPKDVFPEASLALLNHGLELDGEALKPAKVSWQNEDQLRVVLREGKKRQIRRMCEAVGLHVVGLKRVRIGRIPLGALPVGQWRYLTQWEKF